jgi:hypothetical protein
LTEPVEVLDFYQLICFLLQIPARPHSGSWDHIEEMLNVSGAHSISAQNYLIFVLFATIVMKLISN